MYVCAIFVFYVFVVNLRSMLYKKIFLVFLLTLSSFVSFSQSSSDKDVQVNINDNRLLYLDIVMPGISYETRIQKFSTLRFSTNFTPSLSTSKDEYNISAMQQFSVQYRYYYNLQNRISLGRNVSKFSLNYLAIKPVFWMNYTDSKYNNFAITPTWGLQRSYGNWYFNLELGANFFVIKSQNSSQDVFPTVNLKFGYILIRK